MIDKNSMIKVVNKFGGTVGYDVPDLRVHRDFYPHEQKQISFNELERLSFLPGGKVILSEYLEIKDEEAAKMLFGKEPEPEYHYSNKDIEELMKVGTLEQFLDCLDFAPESVLENIKDMAVNLPLNDVSKRNAIQEKLGFDVSKAIEIKNTKFDSGEEDTLNSTTKQTTRRATPIKKTAAPTGRRYKPNN